MSHPTTLVKDTPYITEFRTYDPENPGQAKAPDSLPTATVYKNGTANGDSVTITNISTGLYKLVYNPASEIEGDFFSIDVNSIISSISYPEIINFIVLAVERGTDSAYTGTPPTAAAIRAEIDSNSTQLTAILNRIGAWTGSGVNTLLGAFKALFRNDASLPSDIGGTMSPTTDSVEAISNSIASLSNLGSGTYSITLTVDDGSNPVPNAHVSLSAVGQTTRSGTTNGSGVITFSSDGSITWNVTITAGGGLTYTPSTIAVTTANVTQTLSMSQSDVDSPAAPNLSTGVLTCLGTDGLVESGVRIQFELTSGPGDSGYALDAETFILTSDANGLISHDFIIGATYQAKRGFGDWVSFTVADAVSFNLPEILGSN